MKYTRSRTKNKRKSLRDIFLYNFRLLYLFNYGHKFAVTETRTYDIAHDENRMNSKVYIRVRSKVATGVL